MSRTWKTVRVFISSTFRDIHAGESSLSQAPLVLRRASDAPGHLTVKDFWTGGGYRARNCKDKHAAFLDSTTRKTHVILAKLVTWFRMS